MATPAGFVAFRYRDFTFYFIARIFNAVGVMMVDVGIGWLVYSLTQSALALGLVGLCIFLPNVLLALPAGQIADMFDRKYVLVACNLVSTTASLGVLMLSLQPQVSVTLLFVFITIFGIARAISNPAGQAMVASLVPAEHLGNAVALSSSAFQTAIIAGPALGGLLYAFGPSVVFAATTLCFALSLFAFFFMRKRGTTGRPEKFSFAYMTAGIHFIFSQKIILGAITLDLFAVLLGGATALLPIYARDILMVGPLGLGLLRSAPAVGALTMSLVIAHFPLTKRAGLRMFQAIALFGAATIGFGLSTSFWVAIPFLLVLGAADMISVVVRSTLIQIETPDEMRGRVAAVNTVFVGASNELGQFESGLVASLVGPVLAVVLGGAGTIAVAGISLRLFPQLRARDSLT